VSDDRSAVFQGHDDPKGRPKRPYEKPSVAWVEKLELKPGLAVACARAVLHDLQCQAGGLLS